ncbi:MAG: 2-C-methyl-D-erythritol 4-phosphate cytidylyltransferase [SAR202 cluster bacterium]|nr:2-C-methyl-D-erythritol 4-phosphate cytidylyltransferase [SAR202 cluster bacterium]
MSGTTGSDDRDPHPTVGVIVVAAGDSRRMDGLDKVFMPLGGMPLILHCLNAFEAAPEIQGIVLVLSESALERGETLVREHRLAKVETVVRGGARRQDSVANGLRILSECDFVIVHDGARPFVDRGLVSRALDAVAETGAASAAVPVKDTIKVAGPDMIVNETPDRRTLWAAQTPQAFRTATLRNAHERLTGDVTDDASMVEALGVPVKLFLGAYENLKVTTHDDVALAESILSARSNAGAPGVL